MRKDKIYNLLKDSALAVPMRVSLPGLVSAQLAEKVVAFGVCLIKF